MQRFTNLKVWQLGHELVLDIYRATRSFPTEERFALTSQLRRSAASVPTNVAEGSKRKTNGEFARFLNISESSLAETEYQVMLARDLGYLSTSSSDALLEKATQLAQMLNALRLRVEREPTLDSRP